MKKAMLLAACSLAAMTVTARAQQGVTLQINTGGTQGAYHSQFCPPVEQALAQDFFKHKCTPSKGTVENIERALANPSHIGFGQFDVYALERSRRPEMSKLKVVRDDIASECLFMVTKNQQLENYGDVAGRARRITFVLPPKGTGPAATFEYLKSIDPDGLGEASEVVYADSADAALDKVLGSSEPMVTLFVQFPDPKNPRFKKIAEKGGRFVPVGDRTIAGAEVDGKKIYKGMPVEVTEGGFRSEAVKVTTVCTPVVLFTSNDSALAAGSKDQKNQRDMIAQLQKISADKLLPKDDQMAAWIKWSKSVTRDAGDALVSAAETAKQKAKALAH